MAVDNSVDKWITLQIETTTRDALRGITALRACGLRPRRAHGSFVLLCTLRDIRRAERLW